MQIFLNNAKIGQIQNMSRRISLETGLATFSSQMRGASPFSGLQTTRLRHSANNLIFLVATCLPSLSLFWPSSVAFRK